MMTSVPGEIPFVPGRAGALVFVRGVPLSEPIDLIPANIPDKYESSPWHRRRQPHFRRQGSDF